MDTRQPLTMFLVAILVASVFTVVGISSIPQRNASAQTVTIETSADDIGGTFFGEGMLQVIIDDESADDDSDDSIEVQVDLTSSDGSASQTITVNNTNPGSQRFEFFIVHTDTVDQSPDDPETTGSLDDDQILEFGAGAGGDELAVTGLELYDDASFEIRRSGEEVNVDYEEDFAELSLDRETPYGSDSLVHLFITDQDGNLDPTAEDSFTVNVGNLTILLDSTGGDFVDDVTFVETGDNSREFEAIIQLNTTDSAADDEFDFTAETVTMELNDMANYNDPGFNNDENDSTATSEVSFEIDNEDGDPSTIGDLTFAGEIVLTIQDTDRNRDSEEEDDIEQGLTVEVLGDAGSDVEHIDLTETGDNTNIFEIDLSNGELRVTFLEDGEVPDDDNGVLELRPDDIDEDILIEYEDPLSDDDIAETVASFTVEMAVTPGAISAPETVGVNDEFTATLSDPDLNDNKRTRDSYEILLTGASPFNLTRGGDDLAEVYLFDIELDGEDLDFGSEDVSVTMTETGINTGVFEFDIDMQDIGDFGDGGNEIDLDDGSDLDIEIQDFMADVDNADEDTASITIGKPTVGLDFSRTTLPIPPETGSFSEVVGTTVFTTMIVTDNELAEESGEEETFDLEFGDTPFNFTIEWEGDGVEDGSIESLADFYGADTDCDGAGAGGEVEIVDGVSFCEVLAIDTNELLEETGEATGIFEAELEFVDNADADMDLDAWQDLEITFNYFDSEGDEESAGFTFRGNDGVVTVDQPSAKSGTVITITVEDQDLNVDDNEIESFDNVDGLVEDGLLMIETEDEEIEGIDEETFEETGEDTGVFSATFVVGDDIPITELPAGEDEVEQSTNILITYNDDIDSTGGGGDEIEVNVPIVSGTGSIQVTPELVGPATELTILVIDSDLDEDAESIDEYESTDPTGDDFFISFGSDRSEVNEGSPDIEETGPNTGVFMFTLELITDETACEDDDLGETEFEAEGGDTDSSIGACPGDLISIRYEDERTGGGGSATVSEVVEVQSFDPEFVADKDSYGVGDRVTVTISDPDANRDPDIADSLTDIRVRSDSDQVGEELSAIETGRDTGVFRLTFGTTSGTASGAISVKQGDDITVTYTDDFPADFEEEEDDKDFDFTVPIGGGVDVDTTTVTPPTPRDVTGQELDEVSSGQQVVLTTNVVNNEDGPTPFVALIEVRDSNGVTVFLAWQTGTLPANGQSQVGLSWTPEDSGDYEVRTFVISDLNSPRVLSPVATSEITVN